jgi:hypothetical protein
MIYISTSTHFRLRFVRAEALDQPVASNRVDTIQVEGSVLERNNGTTMTVRSADKDPQSNY